MKELENDLWEPLEIPYHRSPRSCAAPDDRAAQPPGAVGVLDPLGEAGDRADDRRDPGPGAPVDGKLAGAVSSRKDECRSAAGSSFSSKWRIASAMARWFPARKNQLQ